MNLVESILRTCKAEEHTNVFKEHGIDGFALKMLNDEDLQMLGVTEEEKRSAILEHANNLLLPAEKPSDLLIDQKYVQLILSQMSAHLLKHMAALSIAVNREDIIVCNIKMNPAVLCLRNCVVSLEKQLDEFESKVTNKKLVKNKNKYKKIIKPTVVIAFVVLVFYKVSQYFPRSLK